MSLKIVAKLPGTHDDCIANLFHLQIVFLDPDSISDTKYMGSYCFVTLPSFVTSFSMTRAPLTTVCMVETYMMRG
jgi:hypothetical protein